MLRKCYADLNLPGKAIHGYKVCNQIGYGGFSVVFTCRDNATGRFYAMKILEMAQYTNEYDMDDVKNEVSLLRFLRETKGPFIGIIDDFEVDGFWYIIMQLADEGDLNRYSRAWEREHNETLPEADVADIMLDVFRGLRILHEDCGFGHRDIKPENIFLLSPDSVDGTRAHIGDFGLAKELSFHYPENSFNGPVGTNWFWAPETCRGVYGCATDIWATGITMFLLLCGGYPLKGVTNNPTEAKDLAFSRGVASLRANWLDALNDVGWHISYDGWDFLKAALDIDQNRRLTARRALEHPFLVTARNAREARYSGQSPPVTNPHPQRASTPTPSPSPAPPTPCVQEQPSTPPATGEEADHPVGSPQRASEIAAEVLRLIDEQLCARTPEKRQIRRIRPDLIGPVRDRKTAIRKRAQRQVTPKVHRTRALATREAKAFAASIAAQATVRRPALVEPSAPMDKKVAKARKQRVLEPAAALPGPEVPQGKTARDLRAERRAQRKLL